MLCDCGGMNQDSDGKIKGRYVLTVVVMRAEMIKESIKLLKLESVIRLLTFRSVVEPLVLESVVKLLTLQALHHLAIHTTHIPSRLVRPSS